MSDLTNLGSTAPDTWQKAHPPISVYNTYLEDAPPFACLQLKKPTSFRRTESGTTTHALNENESGFSCQENLDTEITWLVSKPDSEGAGQQNAAQFVFAGPQGLKAHSFGSAYQGYPAVVLCDGGLSNWRACGPVNDEWFLSSKGWAFTKVSAASLPSDVIQIPGQVSPIWVVPNTVKAPPLVGAMGFTQALEWDDETGGHVYPAGEFLTPFHNIRVLNNFSSLSAFGGFGAYGGFNGFGVFGGFGAYNVLGGYNGFAAFGAFGSFGSFNGFNALAGLNSANADVDSGLEFTVEGDTIIAPAKGRYAFSWQGIIWSGRLGEVTTSGPADEAENGATLTIEAYHYVSQGNRTNLLTSASTQQRTMEYLPTLQDISIADADGTLADITTKFNQLLDALQNDRVSVRGAQNLLFTGTVDLEEGDGLKFKNGSESSISLWSAYVTVELLNRIPPTESA